jgi:hypothetical protein
MVIFSNKNDFINLLYYISHKKESKCTKFFLGLSQRYGMKKRPCGIHCMTNELPGSCTMLCISFTETLLYNYLIHYNSVPDVRPGSRESLRLLSSGVTLQTFLS